MRRRLVAWLVAGLAGLLAMAVSGAVAPDAPVTAVFTVLFILWIAISCVVLCWFFWRWLTYRVSTRLLLSYLLLGVMPFVLCAALAGFALYLAMGQYTSVRFGTEMELLEADLLRDCRDIVDAYRLSGETAAAAMFHDAAHRRRHLVPRVVWVARLGGLELTSDTGVPVPDLTWMAEDTTTLGRMGGHVFSVVGAVAGTGVDRVVAVVPLDDLAAQSIGDELWFDVKFVPLDDDDGPAETEDGGRGLTISTGSDAVGTVKVDDQLISEKEMWPAWPDEGSGLVNRPWVFWFRLAIDTIDLATGEAAGSVISLLRTSPMNVWKDFTSSRYELGTHLWGALVGFATFFLVVYGLALLIAATMIVSITRSTARLSKGATAVERGELDYRIPVKRHDQLGDLAASFNRMTQSVEDMLEDVAEKERLAKELELAREIQESLLPERHLRLGVLSVHALFRPAAEVGGDYFDVFPMGDDRLVLVVGDVAGHGLHAGLLMASLKSTVAALVHEGYSGKELVTRVNDLLLDRRSGPTMTTLVVVDLDLRRGTLRLTNAGHPPVYVIDGGTADEVMVSSLPLGSPLSEPKEIERAFPAGARLLLYSDGLVEATDENGEPFSYERLARIVNDSANLAGGELEAIILAALDNHIGDRPLADDLTILVVERGSRNEGATRPPVS